MKRFRLAFASAAAVALAGICSPAVADVLVRSCDAAGAACARWSWVAPANAKAVQVQRTGTPFVTLADVQLTERIASCYDDAAVLAGSATACTTRVPGRTDLWQLKSVLFPAAAPATKTLVLEVRTDTPTWEKGGAVSSNVFSSLGVRLYGAPEGQTPALLTSAPFATLVSFSRELPVGERWCFTASLTLTVATGGDIDQESDHTAPWCGTSADPAPVLRLAPPDSITGRTPTP